MDITKENLAAPFTAKNSSEIEIEFQALADFLSRFDFLQDIIDESLSKVPVDNLLEKLILNLSKSKVPTLTELHSVCLLVECHLKVRTLYGHLIKFSSFIISEDIYKKIERDFVKPLRKFIMSDGTIDYNKHPELRPLNEKLLQIEAKLRHVMQELLGQDKYKKALQIDEFDIINDRYVLAIKTDSYNFQFGSIVARSSSGNTLFIEPLEAKNIALERIELLLKMDEIILRICHEFSNTLHLLYIHIEKMLYATISLDNLWSRTKYCRDHRLIRPTISNHFQIEFDSLFHPLLKNPVSNDITIEQKKHGIVISGPNTGGKTVLLKSITLAHLFIHFGLFVPAKEATIYPVEKIYYFGNDQQSIAQGLSSFASEANNYLELINDLQKTSQEKSLIVVDEIFNSTSSEEASALAIGLLQEIEAIADSKILISTHHQLFKTLIHSGDKYISASMGHDVETNSPTYKLHQGTPGSSMAFYIFDKISKQKNISTNIISLAKETIDKKTATYESLLQELSHKRVELDKLVDENRSLNLQLKNQKNAMEGTLKLEKIKLIKEYQEELDKIISDGNKLLKQIKNQEINSHKSFLKNAQNLEVKISQLGPNNFKNKEEKKYDHLLKAESVTIGGVYFSKKLEKEITVLAIKKDSVYIQHKNIKMWINHADLYAIAGKRGNTNRVKVIIDRDLENISPEINCRGMRLEEFESIIQKHLISLDLEEIPYLLVVHGHGEGILKKWLRAEIEKNSTFFWKAEDGNDGATYIYKTKN